MAKCLIDLDGTLSLYPGSDFRSLFNKMSDFYRLRSPSPTEGSAGLRNSSTDSSIAVFDGDKPLVKQAAQESAQLMVNRFTHEQITRLIDNIKSLHKKFGDLLIFSLNHKIVGEMYLTELKISEYFDVENSYFRDNIPATKKEKIWPDIMKKYPKIIYLEDDITTVNKLKEICINSNKEISLHIYNSNGEIRKSISGEYFDVKFIHLNGCWMGDVDLRDT